MVFVGIELPMWILNSEYGFQEVTNALPKNPSFAD